MKRFLILSAGLILLVVSLWSVTGSQITFTLGTTPGNPAAGKIRLWANTSSGNLECLNSSGATCLPSGGSNICTDNPTAGALGATNTANHTYCLTGAYTSSTALTISAASVTIQCTKGSTITFTGTTTDGFDISGNDDTIRGCTLDGNSTQTKPVLNITGNRATIEYNTFQNMGVTSPTTANVYVNGGTGHKIRHNYWPSITDQVVFVENTTDSTTMSDITVENNLVGAFNPGVSTLYGMGARRTGSIRILTRVHWINNTMNCQGNSGRCMWQDMDVTGTGESNSGEHLWDGNRISITGAANDCFHWFGNYHSQFTNNVCQVPSGTAILHPFSLGDTYFSNFSHNISRVEAGDAYAPSFTSADQAYNAFDGNVCDGAGSNGTPPVCFYWYSTSGINSHNVISNNTAILQSTAASTCYRIESLTASFTTVDNQLIGNHCLGTGNTGQIGVQLVETTGTMSGTYVSGNYLSNLPTGISIGSGVDTTKLGDHYFETVTTQVSDSGSNTSGVTHTVRGTCVLGTSCAVTLAQGGFSASTSYQCTATDQTSAAAVKVVNTSATVATFTGTGTDTLAYICTGF